jgi:hypothetical protein
MGDGLTGIVKAAAPRAWTIFPPFKAIRTEGDVYFGERCIAIGTADNHFSTKVWTALGKAICYFVDNTETKATLIEIGQKLELKDFVKVQHAAEAINAYSKSYRVDFGTESSNRSYTSRRLGMGSQNVS